MFPVGDFNSGVTLQVHCTHLGIVDFIVFLVWIVVGQLLIEVCSVYVVLRKKNIRK